MLRNVTNKVICFLCAHSTINTWIPWSM